jgi:hypothetical protein
VHLVEVEVVGAQPAQRVLDLAHDPPAGTAALVRVLPHRDEELGGQDDVVAPSGDGPSDQLLVGVRPVELSRVDQRDAQLEGAADGANRLRVVAAGAGVEGRHAHRAQPDARYVEVGE